MKTMNIDNIYLLISQSFRLQDKQFPPHAWNQIKMQKIQPHYFECFAINFLSSNYIISTAWNNVFFAYWNNLFCIFLRYTYICKKKKKNSTQCCHFIEHPCTSTRHFDLNLEMSLNSSHNEVYELLHYSTSIYWRVEIELCHISKESATLRLTKDQWLATLDVDQAYHTQKGNKVGERRGKKLA